KTAALAGAVTVNDITGNTGASIADTALDEAGNVTTVHAHDDSQIDSLAGSAGVAATAGLGASIAVNKIGSSVNAHIDGGVHDRLYHAKDVTVRAENGNA